MDTTIKFRDALVNIFPNFTKSYELFRNDVELKKIQEIIFDAVLSIKFRDVLVNILKFFKNFSEIMSN